MLEVAAARIEDSGAMVDKRESLVAPPAESEWWAVGGRRVVHMQACATFVVPQASGFDLGRLVEWLRLVPVTSQGGGLVGVRGIEAVPAATTKDVRSQGLKGLPIWVQGGADHHSQGQRRETHCRRHTGTTGCGRRSGYREGVCVPEVARNINMAGTGVHANKTFYEALAVAPGPTGVPGEGASNGKRDIPADMARVVSYFGLWHLADVGNPHYFTSIPALSHTHPHAKIAMTTALTCWIYSSLIARRNTPTPPFLQPRH